MIFFAQKKLFFIISLLVVIFSTVVFKRGYLYNELRVYCVDNLIVLIID